LILRAILGVEMRVSRFSAVSGSHREIRGGMSFVSEASKSCVCGRGGELGAERMWNKGRDRRLRGSPIQRGLLERELRETFLTRLGRGMRRG